MMDLILYLNIINAIFVTLFIWHLGDQDPQKEMCRKELVERKDDDDDDDDIMQ